MNVRNNIDTLAGPLDRYIKLCDEGVIKLDPNQRDVAEQLQFLFESLVDTYTNNNNFIDRLMRLKNARKLTSSGIYLYGGVGRGKSMLLDLFFQSIPTPLKQHIHFYDFMRNVHEKLHQLRQQNSKSDPLHIIASMIAEQSRLICFDEFFVNNIVDAMILAKLFETLFDLGVIVVFTSNTAPKNLYKDGLQREQFLPFINLIEQKFNIIEMPDGQDYRRRYLRGKKVYFSKITDETHLQLNELFCKLTDNQPADKTSLTVKGREINISKSAKGCAWFSFNELCDTPLGAEDYAEISKKFHTIFVCGIPKFSNQRMDLALRFVTLIDVLYETNTLFICTATAEPDSLVEENTRLEALNRTISRLHEMQSSTYLMQSSSLVSI